VSTTSAEVTEAIEDAPVAGQLTFHEAADLFPLMGEERFRELVEDIRRNGLLHPIVLWNGKILDGRNRYLAWIGLGHDPATIRTETYDGNPFDYAWSANGQRRDLVQDQRYLIWKRCQNGAATWNAEHDKTAERANKQRSESQKGTPKAEQQRFRTSCADTFRDRQAEEAKTTRAAVAKEAGVNRGSVERMDRLDKERPDLADKVVRGELKPTEAIRAMKKEDVVKRIAALPAGKYRVIYADPPWSYNDTREGLGSGDNAQGGVDRASSAAKNHYPTMSLSDICALDVKSLAAPDSVLLCWATSPLLPEALEVLKTWGFKYKTHFVWDKTHGSFGHYHKAEAELLLVATRGACTPDVDIKESQIQRFPRSGHSRKPSEFRDLIDRIWSKGPRIELFQRKDAVPSHWSVWGAESVEVAA
jgi:N6-adenosine-specific RNA methylase IME4